MLDPPTKCYAGASVDGRIMLFARDREPALHQLRMGGFEPAPKQITSTQCAQNPEDALALALVTCKAVDEMYGALGQIQIWGPSVFSWYLTDELLELCKGQQFEGGIVFLAMDELGQMGPAAMDATPVLIEYVKGSFYPGCARETLKAITGQDLWDDGRAWQVWWEQKK